MVSERPYWARLLDDEFYQAMCALQDYAWRVHLDTHDQWLAPTC